MPSFTKKEIHISIGIGIGAFLLGSLAAFLGARWFNNDIGTPEYTVSLRNTGYTLMVLSALWTQLAVGWRIILS